MRALWWLVFLWMVLQHARENATPRAALALFIAQVVLLVVVLLILIGLVP